MSSVHTIHAAPTQRGYTLLELMMTLFIISILALIAIPLYQDYKTRVKISEGVNLAGALGTTIAEYHMNRGAFPSNNTQAGLARPVSYQTTWVSEIHVSDTPSPGSIVVTFNPTTIPTIGTNNTLIFVPDINSSRVNWDCTYGTLANRYRPKNCQK